jgi:hypothetical protein
VTKSHPEVIALSRSKAEAYDPEGFEVCISITNPNSPPATLSPKFKAVLRLCFSDITGPSEWDFNILFDQSHAKAISDFALQ